jgi:cytochrome P450
VRDLDAFAQEVIDERRQKSLDDGTDLLSRCMNIADDDGKPFSDKYLRDIIMNFMYAAYTDARVALSISRPKSFGQRRSLAPSCSPTASQAVTPPHRR